MRALFPVIFGFLPLLAIAQPAENHEQAGLVLGPNDSISITAFEAEEISKAWRIGATGDLDLPMIGRIRAAGLTVEQLEAQLVQKLRRYVREPKVSVIVSEFKSQPITVTGAVEKAGTLQLQGFRTLFDILTTVGVKDHGPTLTLTRAVSEGATPLPDSRQTEDGRFWVAEYDVRDALTGRSDASRTEIKPRDVIAVSARQPRLVHIMGEVAKPGSVELLTSDTVSITKLVAVAGGLTRLAAPKKVMIRHIGPQGVSADTAIVDLKQVVSGKTADLELGEGDIVIVPSSQFMTYLQTVSMTAVNSSIFSGFQILARF